MPRVIDIEIYSDYSLLMWLDSETGSIGYLEQYPGKPFDTGRLLRELKADTTLGFNSNRYDIPILRYALTGADCKQLKQASDDIILRDMTPWQLEKRYDLSQVELDHIDIMEPTPGVQVSLKSYAGRIHAPRMQDLPIEPDQMINPAQREELRTYCANDLDVTLRLYRTIEDRIKLRVQMGEQYGLDLRSKSDAQIAEAVIKHEIEVATGRTLKRPVIEPGTTYRYRSPGFINFQTDVLKAAHAKVKAASYVVADTGSIEMPQELADLKIAIGSSVYQMGIGGLHSTEKSVAHVATSDILLVDADVASFYPSIILRCGLYPKHMGKHFLDVYREIVTRRIQAKRSGDKVVNESLKIVLNGSYGKFGSKYSVLYSPDLMIQTTLTGQLALLQLIEQLELHGISVVSANTDGVVIKCPKNKKDEMEAVVWLWQYFSGFEMEYTPYAAIYAKDVNNYIAVKADGKTKCKGLYAEAGLMKNPTGAIVVDAVIANLTQGADVRQTIESCADIRRFITVRSVKGGGVQNGEYLGKTVRWYYSTNARSNTINYKKNGNKVAKSEGALPVMNLPDALPDDIEYAVYAAEANAILHAIGACN